MAAAWSEDVSMCMCTPLPPVPLQITRTMLNGEVPDVIRHCCYWSENSHKSSPLSSCCELLSFISNITGFETHKHVRFQKISQNVTCDLSRYGTKGIWRPLPVAGSTFESSRRAGSFKSFKFKSSVNAFLWWTDKTKEASWVEHNHGSFVVCSGWQTKAASLLYKIHVNQNKVTNNRMHSNQSRVTENNRFGLCGCPFCKWSYLEEMSLPSLLRLDTLITGSKATWNSVKTIFTQFSPFEKSHTHDQFGRFPTTACVTVIMSAQMGQPTLPLWLWWGRMWHYSSAILSL